MIPSRNLQVIKSVLCKHSKYFQNRFSFGNQQTLVTFDPAIISFANVKLLVQYMQTNTLNPTMNNIEQLIFAADYLQMDAALEILMKFLHDDMAKRVPGNIDKGIILMYMRLLDIIERYIEQTGYEETELRMKAVGGIGWIVPISASVYIGLCFKSVMYDQQVLEMSYGCLEYVLSSHILGISEEDVARTIKMWCNHDLATRKRLFPELIRCVRFDPNMKVKNIKIQLQSLVYLIVLFEFQLEFIMEELLCTCKNTTCKCLSAKDYVLVILGLRCGYKQEFTGKGPYESEPRAFHTRWKLD